MCVRVCVFGGGDIVLGGPEAGVLGRVLPWRVHIVHMMVVVGRSTETCAMTAAAVPSAEQPRNPCAVRCWPCADDPNTSLLEVIRTCFLPRMQPQGEAWSE